MSGRQAKAVRRLISLKRSEGIPVALFWLNVGRLGWAAAHYLGIYTAGLWV